MIAKKDVPPALGRRLVFGDAEQIAAIHSLPPIVEPGTWLGRSVRFRAWYPRHEYADPEGIKICDEIEAGRAVVVEDRSSDPRDGRVLVRTTAGEMWCDPDDLQATSDAPCQATDGDRRSIVSIKSARQTVCRVTVEFRGTKTYEVWASSPAAAEARAWELARDDEPDEWEPMDVEVERA